MLRLKIFFLVGLLIICSAGGLVMAEAAAAGTSNPIISYLSFHDANLKDVLYILAKKSGLNIILDDRAMHRDKEPKKISLNLTNIPFSTALDLIVTSEGLAYTRVGNTVVVGEKSELGKNFNYLTTERIKLQYADAFKVKDTLVGLGLIDYDNIFVYGELHQDKEKSSQEKDRLDTTTVQAETPQKQAQGSGGEGNNDVNKASNLTASRLTINRIKQTDKTDAIPANILVIRDTPANILRVKEVIKSLDQSAPKIMVEAKVIEINENGMKELGVDWLTTDEKNGSKYFTSTAFKEQQQPAGEMKLGRFTRLALNFNALVKAQIDQGNAKMLSSPKISTLEGKPAFIYVGDKIPYISARNIDASGENKTITTEVSFLNAGVTLEVLPILTEANEIQLKIYSEVSSIKEWKEIDKIQYPVPSMRQAQTLTRVKAGESIILGGLIYDEEKKTTSKIPILGDIPILKSLFSWSNNSRSKTEVVISLTPYIVK